MPRGKNSPGGQCTRLAFHIPIVMLVVRIAIFGNGMWRRNGMALWTVLCFCSSAGASESFTINPAAAAIGRIEVRYFLTGAFGGFGSFVRNADRDGAYRIPLEQEGKLAKSLKAILYAPGCGFVLLSTDLTTTPTRNATFECRPLSTITLRGKISPPPSGGAALDVQVRYVSAWDHKFFGIADGIIEQFSVGKSPLLPEGQFQLQIPNFSKDRVTTQMQDAYLDVLVIEHSTWNIVEAILPSIDLRCGSGLKILPSYDTEVVFSRRR